MPRRSWLAPAVVQTSALDCGPAALASVARGFGLPTPYARLRELCHTDVDGTSIDAIEVVAERLGLEATQVLVPEDHLLAGESLPAIVVVRLANGLTHFCVIWRQLGPWLQVMDPARGRRWVWARSWLQRLYRHKIRVETSTYREWAESDEFRAALVQRGRRLGISKAALDRLLADAARSDGADELRYLDAAMRLASSLRRAGAWPRWRSARRLERLVKAPRDKLEPLVPSRYLRARRAPGNSQDWLVEGAVAVRFSRGSERASARRAKQARPGGSLRRFVQLLGADGKRALAYLALAAGLAGALLVLEVLVFRFLVAPVVRIQPAEVQSLIAAAVGTLAALALILEHRLTAFGQRLGRSLDVGLRRRLFERLPKIRPRYFASRLSADLASRAHGIYRLRALPGTGRQLVQIGVQIGLTGLALAWLIPAAAGLIVALVGAALLIPLCLQGWQAEHDLTARTHAGALSRFYLGSLQGLTAVQAHGAERALEREHEALLTRWGRVSQRLLRLNLAGFVAQSGLCTVLAAAIVISAVQATGTASATLLITYWALRLPPLGQAFSDVLRQLPALKTTAERIAEPLAAPVWPVEATHGIPRAEQPQSAPALDMRNVRVVAGGRTRLEIPSLTVKPGERLALVGRSGAGKSTLLRTILGLVDHVSDNFEIFGKTHCQKSIFLLRERMNWLDPDVYLYDSSVLENLLFGASVGSQSLGDQVEAAGLNPMLARRSGGIETQVGEGGVGVSGGEGQRIRFGRALGQSGELLLWDEAFRGLEQITRQTLLARALSEWPLATLLYVTHDLREAYDYFERVLVIQGGRIVQDGHPKELVNQRQGAFAQLMRFEEERSATLADPDWQQWRLGDGKLRASPARGNDRQPRLV